MDAVRALTGHDDVLPQAPGDIGARMRAAAAALFADRAGAGDAGRDRHPRAARGAGRAGAGGRWAPRPAADVVFGPAADGGYYLVALRRLRDDREATLFAASIPWGGPAVLARSQAAAAAAGLRSARVETLHDIDTAADLTDLRARLDGAAPGARVAGRRTDGGRAGAGVAALTHGAGGSVDRGIAVRRSQRPNPKNSAPKTH